MAKKTEEDDSKETSLDGCYGEKVSYEGLDSFLEDAFASNREADERGSNERFATCIWGHSGIGKCVSGNTLIKTERGIVPIGSLFLGVTEEGFYPAPDGMMVDTSEGMMPVDQLYYSGVKKAIRIKTNFGRSITGSLIHPLMVASSEFGWKKLSEVKIGDFLVLNGTKSDVKDVILPEIPTGDARSRKDFTTPKVMNADLAYVIGAIIGEGNTMEVHTVQMTQSKDKPLTVNYLKKFETLFGLKPNGSLDKRTTDTTTYSCNRTILRDWFEMIGVDKAYSREKSVPWSVLQSSLASQRGFLSAIYEAEGSNEDAGIALSSASQLLIQQVSFMLLQWGIQSGISSRFVKGTEYWSLLCGGDHARKLQQLTMFSRATRSWMKIVRGNPNRGGLPMVLVARILKEMKASHRANGGIITKKAIHTAPLNRLYNLKHAPKIVSQETVDAWASFFSKADPKFKQELDSLRGLLFERIVSIEDADDMPLYDVSMATESHEFIADGFVSHNTAKIKQHCKKPVTWRGKNYPGYAVFDVPVAQFEEMGDLHGMPSRHVKLARKGNGQPEETWVAEEVVQGWFKDGWEIMPSGGVRTMYAPPDWVPREEGPSILLLDDWNRTSVRIIKGTMQLLQNYGMVSWKLPAGCNIVLTANPDEQDYLVTSIDSAILTRIRSVTLVHDVKEWAVWAEGAGLDYRGINFLLRYPEMMIGNERTNPRTLAQCFRDMKRIPDISHKDQARRFQVLAASLLDEQTVSTLITFLDREIELIIEPEQILAGRDWTGIEAHMKKLMGGREKRVDVLGVICDRLYAKVVQPDCKPDKESIKNFQKFLLIDDIPEDMRHNICMRLSRMKDQGKSQQWILQNEKLVKIVLSVL
jgi:intein/homing endonuclease